MKIKINPKYEEMRSFIERIPDVFEQEGREQISNRSTSPIKSRIRNVFAFTA